MRIKQHNYWFMNVLVLYIKGTEISLKALCQDIRLFFSKLMLYVMYHAQLIEKRPSLFNKRLYKCSSRFTSATK